MPHSIERLEKRQRTAPLLKTLVVVGPRRAVGHIAGGLLEGQSRFLRNHRDQIPGAGIDRRSQFLFPNQPPHLPLPSILLLSRKELPNDHVVLRKSPDSPPHPAPPH